MDWTYLGHASWLVDASGLRLLFDPLLDDPHQGGTYGVWPPRDVHAEALRADFLLVSHAHGDHFDVRSLARLARLDPDTVVLTPDPLVAHVAREVGFRVVREIAAGHVIELDGARLVLTPSHAPDPEWGAVVMTGEGVVWNQIDTVLGSADEVRHVVRTAAADRRIDLALVRWAPLLEIDAQVPGSLAFPFADYAALLGQIDAIGATALVPAAAGQRHVGSRWLDGVVLPVSPSRVLDDLAVRCAPARALPPVVGGVYRVREGQTVLDEAGGRHLATPHEAAGPDPRAFRPLAIPVLVDPGRPDAEPALARTIERWLQGPLAEALAHAWRSMAVEGEARLGLEIVFPSGPRAWTFLVGEAGATLRNGLEPELDVLDVLTATALTDVLAGRRSWAHVLLAGELRATHRAYRANATGLTRPAIAPIFLYYALPYPESTRRATLAELAAVRAGEPPPWQRGR